MKLYFYIYKGNNFVNLNMKSISDIVNESCIITLNQMINEHYVNCKNHEEMEKYKDIVWKILERSYEYCGGLKSVDGPDHLVKKSHLWKLCRRNKEINAVICYSNSKGGRKLCYMGQDGTPEGKKDLLKMLEDDFRLKDRESWTGVSGKAVKTALKTGAIPVPAEVACKMMPKCKPHDEWWVEYPLKNQDGSMEVHLKLIVGNPPGHESLECPQELKDKLIEQALKQEV